VLLYYTKFKLA